MGRMRASISDLIEALPQGRHAVLEHSVNTYAVVARSFADEEEKIEARVEDRQDLGCPIGDKDVKCKPDWTQ